MPAAAVFAVDAVLVVVFAVIGRASHREGLDVNGVLTTAWPFLAGLVVGWLLAKIITKRLPMSWRTAWPVWLGTVVVGMALRALTGQGTAPAFIAVATITLAILLLGWRLLARAVIERPART